MTGQDDADRRVVIGPYHVVLHRGLFRSRVSVYRDVRPALGGLLGTGTYWRSVAEDKFNEAVRIVSDQVASG